MFGRAYWGGRYYGARYWGDGGASAPPGASAAQVWNYVLSNGLTAQQNVVQIYTWLNELHLIHGLRLGSPLEVTQTSRAAGAVEQTIAEAGSDVTVTRQ